MPRASLEERLARLRQQMEEGLTRRAAEFRACIERLDAADPAARAELRRIAHRLRGTAGSHGRQDLGALAAEVERLARDGAPEVELRASALALVRSLGEASGSPRVEETAPHDAGPHDAGPHDAGPHDAGPALSGLRVIAVDDDAATRRLLELTLVALAKADARIVESPERALGLAASAAWDLLVVDAMMPGTTGLALARAVRASARNERIPVAFLSAASVEELGWTLPPYSAWMRKPFRPNELVSALAALVASVRSR